ncbi:LacI family DNA-binding transcriptional regulator [Alteromonas aestuariivivens]|uniref:LacI family DNA-binding transcriptional regulator n=1 Tax=Alteromonas aestuariivivens TaxID=1938339 RepID=A0A3D8MEN0_9ALTE|nr:LacI family DNA-binding transcriptional regulator [Alteromonas aestuariivivens]RDV29011.1 LacI family DNA-binding transcriptional regulator [Alteromonas aestuariivivens]
MATIKDVARAAGVSLATVSRVVNDGPKVGDATRERVKKIMQELGYRPNATARALVTQKSAYLGVVIADLQAPFFALLAHGVEVVTRKNNVRILLSAGSLEKDTELQAIETLLEHRVDAMVVHSKLLDDETLIDFARQVPGFILINRYIPQIGNRCIWLDNVAGGRSMAQYAYQLGHKNIAVISSRIQIDDPHLRVAGIKQAAAEAGRTIPDSMIEYSSPDQEGGELATQNLIASGQQFSVILAYNDAMAAGAMATLLDHGIKVPEEVSVMGYDDLELAKFCRPKLTTLRYPIEMMASKAADLALRYASGEEPGEGLTFKYTPTIVKRDSLIALK